MDLSVNLGGLDLEYPFLNAAGTCKKLEGEEGLVELARSETGAITLGSYTVEARGGNEGDVYEHDDVKSLNSLGLPGPSLKDLAERLPEMVSAAHEKGKPVIVSAAGFAPKEFAQLIEVALEKGADAGEVNLGCPNVWDGGEQKGIASFSPSAILEILQEVKLAVGSKANIWVKLSPFSNPEDLKQAAKVLGDSELVKVVVAVNTFPNAFVLDEGGNPWITPGGGLAGMAGPALKPIGLGQVKQLRAELPERIQIVGVGGAQSGQDILDYKRAGADAVETATGLMNEGAGIFGRALGEYVELPGVNSA